MGEAEALSLAVALLQKIICLPPPIPVPNTQARELQCTGLQTLDDVALKIVAAIRERRNRFPAVNRLPPELLGHIFSLVPSGDLDDRREGLPHVFNLHSIAPMTELLPLTTVCRYWRAVATSTPHLWSTFTEIEGKPCDPAIASSSRSQTAPMYLVIRSYQPAQATRDLLAKEGGRIEELKVTGTYLNRILGLSNFPANNLRFCKLAAYENDWPPASLTLFQGHTPSLRTLYLRGPFASPTNTFPALTHLILKEYWPTSPHNISDFIAFLSRCPVLRELNLEMTRAVEIRFPAAAHAYERLLLPHLRKLSLIYTQPWVGDWRMFPTLPTLPIALLDRVLLPDTCLVHLTAVQHAYIKRLMRALSGCAPHLFDPARGATHMKVVTRPKNTNVGRTYTGEDGRAPISDVHTSFHLLGPPPTSSPSPEPESKPASDRGSESPQPHTEPDTGAQTPGIRIDILGSPETGAYELALDLCALAPLFGSVRGLWVDARSSWLLDRAPGAPSSSYPARSILTALPRLETLVVALPRAHGVGTAGASGCLGALAPPTGDGRADAEVGGRAACPALRTLAVSAWHAPQLPQVAQVGAVVRARAEAGCAVARVALALPRVLSEVAEVRALRDAARECVVLVEGEGEGAVWQEDVVWERYVPRECRARGEYHHYWPAWA